MEAGRTRAVKARLFYLLNLKVSSLQRWKEFAKKAKNQKEILKKERAIEEDTIKRYLALKYRERNISLKIFSAWAMFSKIQSRKRKFEALNTQKETSKKKVDDFLNSLENISTTSNEWIRQKIKKEKEKPQPISYSVSLKRLVCKTSKSNTREIKESQQLPKIEEKPKNQKDKGKVDETYQLQKEIISAQRQKMREQWKQIESLKEQKTRLVNHRPATDSQLLHKMQRKIFLDSERKNIEEERVPPVQQQEEGEEGEKDASERAESDCNYSEDFEDCSQETESGSVIPRTPEMLRRVREREEVRANRRAEIKKLHQERVEQERERLRRLKEKELQEELEERKRTRELWKKKRREEIERDKRKIAEQERQERLTELAEEFHRKLMLKQFGFRPWRKLISTSEERQLTAHSAFELKTKRFFLTSNSPQSLANLTLFCCFRKFLSGWLEVVRAAESDLVSRAECWASQTLLRKCWRSWHQVTIIIIIIIIMIIIINIRKLRRRSLGARLPWTCTS